MLDSSLYLSFGVDEIGVAEELVWDHGDYGLLSGIIVRLFLEGDSYIFPINYSRLRVETIKKEYSIIYIINIAYISDYKWITLI